MSPRARRLGVVVAALAAALTGTASASPAPHAPLVLTTGGLVRGVATDSSDQFLGIPYAAPPTGALRWQPPQPAARWHGIRDASKFGAACAQPAGPFGRASDSEDCLYLNVYTPSRPAYGRPVMVWLHGGGLVSGSGDLYDPTGLVRNGTVVVTINYRLGAFGFLAHAALADKPGGPSGNYGLMDQQAALRWVERNIARFGGDSRNVTIFGESAGGLSVLSQLASPTARGLFDRAIAQSGAYALTQRSLQSAEAAGQAFATAASCADQSAACLRGLSVAAVLAHQNQDGYEPNIDGKVLTQSIGTAFASGQFARVPVINGSNRDEWRLFVAQAELAGQRVTADNYFASIQQVLNVPAQVANVIAAQYPLSAYPSPPLALSAVGTDAIFACPALKVDTVLSKYVPTFGYEFNDENAPPLLPPVSFPQGAAHGTELEYLFKLPIGGALSPDQERLAAAMRQAWTTFAASGRPPAVWPKFTPATQPLLSLVPPKPQVETDFATVHKCAFWSGLPG
ncbi:carboxylesterase family protein [Actinocrispum sp. NPDC049592]|uniref:carboxylesterase/lipase family protein n=1 Tax=Actinocrispum sp. NPDC049592 TaxID=3154835 RepID=UPI00341DBBA3